jgi:glutamyl-tRNA synthetase
MAIVNYLFARTKGGTVHFRSEDTDRARSKREYEDDIKEQLTWLGLSWDDFSRSTEFVSNHTAAMQKLVEEDKAYISKEDSKAEPGNMVEVVRLRNFGTVVTFEDVLRGPISFDTTELGDFVIGRSIDDPLYHLAVVVDDATQGITHVIRGEDHISNTPRQILIQKALGYPRPVYAHYPLHLGADRAKLSKRTGDVAIRSYREKGYLPEAMRNYIAVLGWTPPSGKEFLTLDDMVAEFALEDLHKSGAVFDLEKLRWFNRHYLLARPEADFEAEASRICAEELHARGIESDGVIRILMPTIRERISVWEDLREAVREGEYDFFFKDPPVDASGIPGKDSSPREARTHLEAAERFLKALAEDSFKDSETIKASLWEYATREGRGKVLWPLRYALTGKDRSPDPFTVARAIGKEATIRRIASARTLLEGL